MNNNNKQAQERNRKKLNFRIMEGIKSAVFPPFLGSLPILVLTVLIYIALTNRALPFDTNMPDMIFKIFDYIKIGALVSIFLSILLALLVILGTPYKCRTAENAMLRAFKLQLSPSECPILISSKHMKNGTRRWEFFSMWVTMDEWRTYHTKILYALDCHLVGQIQHGGKNKNNSHRIVFYTNQGAKPFDRGVLTDEEI